MDFSSATNHFLWGLLSEPTEKDKSLVCTWCGGHAMFSTREDRISLCHDCWEEYLYEISEENKQIHLTVYEIGHESGATEIFHGTPEELLTKLELDYA